MFSRALDNYKKVYTFSDLGVHLLSVWCTPSFGLVYTFLNFGVHLLYIIHRTIDNYRPHDNEFMTAR